MNSITGYFKNYFYADKKNPVTTTEYTHIGDVLDNNINYLKDKFNGSADFTVRYLTVNNVRCAIITMEGMCNKDTLSLTVLNPLLTHSYPAVEKMELFLYIEKSVLASSEIMRVYVHEKIMQFMMSGFAILLIDGCSTALSIGAQGFSFRSVSEPESEASERGSREGLVEPLRINMTLIRRRIKNPDLKFETMTLGGVSKTDICLCYLTNAVSESILEKLRKKLKETDLDNVLASGYLVSYLEDKNDHSIFSGVGVTERPDTVSGKINEGRIAILIDGTPSALIIPYLFVENFQTMGDYSYKPYYATLIRMIKYICFFIASLLPGLYTAFALFNPELFPEQILNKVATSIGSTPFGLITEILLVLFMYEIMREAGLRLPKTLGHAVSIVGALVIGDTAVSAGLIGAPTLLIVALTAIASYVIPTLYPQMCVLRVVFIFAGGFFGIWGIVLLFCVVAVNMCGKSVLGVPYTMPLAPFKLFSMRDVAIRADWKLLNQQRNLIRDRKQEQ
ncbi:MAG: spore germination protein [Acutalibacteraceae bacterium]|nr:spore germination protein [Acutalibacteraceae bacterium]